MTAPEGRCARVGAAGGSRLPRLPERNLKKPSIRLFFSVDWLPQRWYTKSLRFERMQEMAENATQRCHRLAAAQPACPTLAHPPPPRKSFRGAPLGLTMSDSFGSFIFGPASRLPSAVPATTRRDDPKTSQVPVYDVRTCLRSSTPWSPVDPHHTGSTGVAFDRVQSLGTPDVVFCGAP